MVKNWLGRKGLHYIETLIASDEEPYNTLEGLFDTLGTKCKPQYNEMLKSLQFRKLYRLHVVVAECNYRELDRQLEEQFIHGPNDKCMLDEIIRDLTVENNDEQVTSEGMLIWVKRIEA